MGTSSILSETLFGHTRGAVLSVLYGHAGEVFYLRQLARLTGAQSSETRRSDVDLMIVGNVDFGIVVEKLADAQRTLNREINPTVYSLKEFRKKVRESFLKTVLADKKLFIIGDEDVLKSAEEADSRTRYPSQKAESRLV